jgi:hypothetical protein
MTNAQRARAKRGWRFANADFNFQTPDFCPLARCAFVMTNAQRASYGRRRAYW